MNMLRIGELSLEDLTYRFPNTFKMLVDNNHHSRITKFFDKLYNYPSKFYIKWEALSASPSQAQQEKHPFNFVNLSKDFFCNESITINPTTAYYFSHQKEYLDDGSATKFFETQLKLIGKSLEPIPVYTILNTRGEIVLAHSTNFVSSPLYNFADKLYTGENKTRKLGLFFFSKEDATMYMNEVAKLDPEGTEVFGLSIHAVSLDFAYRLLRTSNLEIDFKFVPNLAELENLLLNSGTFNGDYYLFKLRNKHYSNGQNTFTGVPIYIVKMRRSATDMLFDPLPALASKTDSKSGHNLDSIQFFSPKSKKTALVSQDKVTYIFFKKEQAVQFCNMLRQKTNKWVPKSLIPLLGKPKISLFSLENFLEIFEEAKTQENGILLEKLLKFEVPLTSTSLNQHTEFNKATQPFKKVAYVWNVKWKRLNHFLELILQVS